MTEGEHRVKENKGEAFTPNTLLFNAIQAKGEEVNIKTQKHWTRARELGVLYMDFRLTSPFSENPFSDSFRLPFLSFFA